MCQNDNADLIVVNDLVENSWVYAFSNRDQVDVWLGLRENVSDIRTYILENIFFQHNDFYIFRKVLIVMFG